MNDRRTPLSVDTPTGDAGVYRFAHDAMATTFDLFIAGQEPDFARQAADAAFERLDRLEEELSRFVETSDVSRINRLAAGEATLIGIDTMECLRAAKKINTETNGAFDVTAGSPSARGMQLLEIDESAHGVRVRADGLQLDLGGLGKGYALDQMAEFLDDWGVDSALLSAGQSSVLALGAQPWTVALRDPQGQEESLRQVELRARALSGSGVELHGEHILDPRTGRPATGTLAAWAVADSAILSDALSTAFMILAPGEVGRYCARNAGVSAMLVVPGSPAPEILSFGMGRGQGA